MRPATSQCRTKKCGRPIRWVRTVGGARMPIDAAPNPAGNVQMTEAGAVVHPPGYEWPAGINRWMPHFVTCANGKEWSQGGFPF